MFLAAKFLMGAVAAVDSGATLEAIMPTLLGCSLPDLRHLIHHKFKENERSEFSQFFTFSKKK
jgi:hypothetical protein